MSIGLVEMSTGEPTDHSSESTAGGFDNPHGFDNGEACAYVDFDYESLDSPLDRINELMEQGKTAREAFEMLATMRERRVAHEAVNAALSIILDSKRPGLIADQIAWKSGLHVLMGHSIPALARKHGVSKQAFQQGVARLEGVLGPHLGMTARSEEGRENMRQRHYQKPKIT